MKLREFLLLFALIFFIGCGSKKEVVKKTTKNNKKEVTKRDVKKVTENKLNTVTQETKSLKVTTIEVEEEEKVVNITPNEIAKDITQQYIDKYASIAVIEMNKYKIPASITLAQGVLESGSGRSKLALKSNNHFGIKCHKGWKGSSVTHDDDELGECFRKYKHPETSYEDHSKFLTSRSRYSKLFKLKITNYIGWAYGLKKAGYATDKKYPKKLIAIIKKYHLYNYDNKAIEDMPSVLRHKSTTTSAVAATHEVIKGDTLYSISRRYQTTVELLKEINGLRDNIISIGQELLVP